MTAPQPATTPVALTAADATPEKQSDSIQMLLLVLAGALALAGLIGGVIVRLGRTRRPRYQFPANRRAPWDSMQAGGSSPPIFPSEAAPTQRTKAFSSEVDTGSREENASKKDRAPFRFNRNGKGSEAPRWRASLPPDPRAPDDPERRVTELLARLARSAQA